MTPALQRYRVLIGVVGGGVIGCLAGSVVTSYQREGTESGWVTFDISAILIGVATVIGALAALFLLFCISSTGLQRRGALAAGLGVGAAFGGSALVLMGGSTYSRGDPAVTLSGLRIAADVSILLMLGYAALGWLLVRNRMPQDDATSPDYSRRMQK